MKKKIVGLAIILLASFSACSMQSDKKEDASSAAAESVSVEETIEETSEEAEEAEEHEESTEDSVDVSASSTEDETAGNSFSNLISSYYLYENGSFKELNSFITRILPEYDGINAYTVINDNQPFLNEYELFTDEYEFYSDLDELGRCSTAYAIISTDSMPEEERGQIGQIKPSGWHTAKYDFLEDLYLYNRCHLIGYQLAGENDNEKNLITGTRYLNTIGMLQFENEVYAYVKGSGNHVAYRVTPVFVGDELVARGVLIEAKSVEDNGKGVCFNVYCHNVQPGVDIDYLTGESSENQTQADVIRSEQEQQNAIESETNSESTAEISSVNRNDVEIKEDTTYVYNINSMKFHRPDCKSVKDMSARNLYQSTGTRQEAIDAGYSPCGNCNP